MSLFNGLRTVVYYVEDLPRAKTWWSELLGIEPYFDQPFYVGFNVGGYELGLHPSESGVPAHANVITYWGVEDIEVAFAEVRAAGAVEHQAIQDVGDGIKVAALTDPFGNMVGLICNPHFKLPAS